MRKKKLSKLVLKASEGIFSSLTDLVLWNIFYLLHCSRVKRGAILADRELQRFNYLTIKRAIKRAKEKGWIKRNLTLTENGKKRLKSILPKYFSHRKWDGNWRLVIYDIPKEKKKYRRILRDFLTRLGFGQLQKSVRISPFNFLGDVEKIIEEYNLSPYVVLAITNKLGREDPRVLANRVWKLDKVNERYKEVLREAKKFDKRDLYFKYLDILKSDPQLPKDLLPEDWIGDEVYKLFSKYVGLRA